MAKVSGIMTALGLFCTGRETLQEVAKKMRDGDCGILAVVEDADSMRLAGVITDRDIVVRAVAEGAKPSEASVDKYFTKDVITMPSNGSVKECRQLMEARQVRRIVILEGDRAVGIVSLADLAETLGDNKLGKTLSEISSHETKSD